MAKSNKHKAQRITPIYFLPLFLSVVLIILLLISYDFFMVDKFYPLTFVGDMHISFLTPSQANKILSDQIIRKSQQSLNFYHQDQVFSINLSTSNARLDYSILEQELQKNHPSKLIDRFLSQIQSLISQNHINAKLFLNIGSQIEQVSAAISIPSQNAQLIFDEKAPEGSLSAQIQIVPSVDGVEVDKEKLRMEIENYLLKGTYENKLPIKVAASKITTSYVESLKTILESSFKDPIIFQFEKNTYTLDTKQLLAILDLESEQNLVLDKDKTVTYLAKIAQDIDREVQEGQFEFNPQTKRVSAFKPALEGRQLDIDKTYSLLINSLSDLVLSKTITLPVSIVEPKIKTSDVNNLGIRELLGQGVSYFRGSIPNRIYNINLAASRINGVLIPPGETFSFNNAVGDISAASGYKQAYVIKSGRTVLDDGGGVCQVSTTTFRAILNSGLPVEQRVAHAYRVGYYEQGFPPGLDATVFAPSVDFKFKNDTQHHILIQAYTQGSTLYVDLYGTTDGRYATISKSSVTNITPPPPDLRQDDPTLPKGEVKQVDWPAYGATVNFSRTVKKGAETIISETFKSNYKAWQAVYLVGTKEN